MDDAFAKHGKIDVIVSNAGYGLFGAAEELTDDEANHIIATNLTGSIMLIRSAFPYLHKQESGNIIQISSYGGQVAFAANSMYHATKFGIPRNTEPAPTRQRKSKTQTRVRSLRRLSKISVRIV